MALSALAEVLQTGVPPRVEKVGECSLRGKLWSPRSTALNAGE
jgi:hypothetical protein